MSRYRCFSRKSAAAQAVPVLSQVIAEKRREPQNCAEALEAEMKRACLAKKHGTAMHYTATVLQDYEPPSLLVLNVGGAKLRVKRSALTHVKDSKLAWMFNGRWDHWLPRDHSGHIFLDVDVKWFSPIAEYLSELSRGTAANEAYLPIMQLSDDDRLGFRACVELFGLRDIMPKQAFDSQAQVLASVACFGLESGLNLAWSALWQLLCQSSAHDATTQEFHRLYYGRPNTVCLAIDDEGNVFGGFTSEAWIAGSGTYKPDPAAFLFCKTSDSPTTRCYSQTGSYPQCAVCHHSSVGPLFGGGHDLQFIFSSAGAVAYSSAEAITYRSSASAYHPMPISGTDGTVVDFFVWQVPQAGATAPPSLTPNFDAAVPRQPACSLSYSSDGAPPVAFRATCPAWPAPSLR
ncbi:hypothetical protein JKP88DRAFT_268499 [Tribonema minus]|uniref:TLDc domain-containing protein n=1 Tax=Tribonema minus TaxID=303371 RepID=A0A835Z9G2_9STRA|nr:hypothetical protein JKP88DRAFT_268499 [Tribonema minus]